MNAEQFALQIAFRRGIELPAHGLWLDPWDPRPLAFVSHAHSDHIGRHREIIVSPGTARLMRERLSGERIEHRMPFGEMFALPQLPDVRLQLLPAGHIFGSAQLYLESEVGSLLYSGDFKLRPGLSSERAEVRHAETLIMETTFGKPQYRFPPTAEVIGQVVAFCQDALEEDAVPVLLGYSLGKSQEILCALAEAGLTPMLHGAVYKMTEIYRTLRDGFPDGYLPYAAGQVAGRVLLCPPSAARSPMVTRLPNRRVAVLTGWAIDPGARFRYGVDAAFPLSDHADYDDLLNYVERVGPRRVLTLHGFAAAFARDLRERGIEAWALGEPNQLELSLNRNFEPGAAKPSRPVPAATASSPMESDPDPDDFSAFTGLCREIASSSRKLKKIELLANYFRALGEAGGAKEPEPEEFSPLPVAAVYLTGRPFAQGDARTLQAGWAVIKRAILAVSKIGEARLRAISDRHADAGKTAAEALEGATAPRPWTLAESRHFFERVQKTRGPVAKTELLAGQLARLSPEEAGVLVRILTGDLRIGLKEGLVEEAVASAFAAPLEEVKAVNMLLGDLGRTAVLAREGRLGEAALQLFRPIKVMLASPEPTAERIWERLGESGEGREETGEAASVWLEDKYDGIRAQFHFSRERGRAELYSRDLRPISVQFPELIRAGADFQADVILDGEIVAFDQGRKLTFFDLQKRLGRKEADLFLGQSEIPAVYVAFDLLLENGQSLLKLPLAERRLRLETLALPPRFERIGVAEARSSEEIEAAFHAARGRGNEGLIAKDPQSPYTPGRRGLAWIKLKKEFATLDVVVVGVESGHGKRAGVLSDYTFAVRDEESGSLLPIGKAYSGLTDAEIAELTVHFTRQTIARERRYREVVPDVVLEVAFDSIQPSERHASGLALRFPRIKAIRRDKTVADIDTLRYARQLEAGHSGR